MGELSVMSDCGPVFVGIDPGANGGVAGLRLGSHLPVVACKMPETERDLFELFTWITVHAHFCMIEQVHAHPKQGVSSMFKFGQNYGFLRGMLVANRIPFEEVTPQKWMGLLGCLNKGDKNVTKQKAQQLFPEVKITHAIADALLIAEYCRRIKGDAVSLSEQFELEGI